MTHAVRLRSAGRPLALLSLALAVAAGLPQDLKAQCQVLTPPTAFDPPASGAPSGLRPTNDSMGLSGSGRRLVVRYNYGYVAYGLTNPSSPQYLSAQSFLTAGYPKSGDGQTRTGKIAISPDGQRILLPWTDEPGFGTVVAGPTFFPAGDYLPAGYNSAYSAAVKTGDRYLGFTASTQGVYAADLTTLPSTGSAVKNSIPSEVMTALGTDLSAMTAVETTAHKWVVGSSQDRVVVIDATNPGSAVPNLTRGMPWYSFTAAALGVPSGSTIFNVAAAAHPSDGSLYLLIEGSQYIRPYNRSQAILLKRFDPSTGSITSVASYTPVSGQNIAQNGIVLVALDADVVAFFSHRLDSGGMKLHAHSSLDFGTNLAASFPTMTTPELSAGLVGFRSTGGSVHLYFAANLVAYAMTLDCSTAPGPATATLAVDRVSATGATTSVPDQGNVFIGDQVRIKPSYSPPDSVSAVIDWRLDYDFHDGNAVDSQATTPRLRNADESKTEGPALPPTQLTLWGPCDPAVDLGSATFASPSTGAGCWASVTTNGDYGVPLGTPDFSASSPAARQLAIAFEVQNALNAGVSSVAQHRINWKVPLQVLQSSSLLSGGSLVDASEGTPDTSNPTTNPYRWYFARVTTSEPGFNELTLEPSCTGPTCSPTSFTQPGETSPGLQKPGTYRYWVSVPYRGGFRTPECPGLVVETGTCTGDAAKTVVVTDAVLNLTAPTSTVVGAPSVTITSTSQKATTVAPCLTITGFAYNFCQVSNGVCNEGTYTSSGLTVSNPFASGTITVPNPGEGYWGLRVKYSYSTSGNCQDASETKWPANGAFSPLLVVQATPSVRLRNTTNTADITSFLGTYGLTTGQQAKAYAYINGVQDPNPPSGISWSYRPASGGSPTFMGTAQGQTFSIATAGDYVIELTGYGVTATADVIVDPPASGGGGGTSSGPPTITSLYTSPASPSVGQTAYFYCNATQGGAPITSYDWVLDTGVTRTTSTGSTTYVYSTTGTKTYSCVANDSAGASSSTRVAQLTVLAGGGTGTCSFEIKDASGGPIPYDSQTKTYFVNAGQPLTFVASGATGTVSWDYGNGVFGTGTPASYAYPAVTSVKTYTAALSASGCSATRSVEVAPAAVTLDFSVADAGTSATVEKSGDTYVVTSGQALKFKASNATGEVWWEFGDGTNSALASPDKTYTAVVDTTFTAALSNAGATKTHAILVKGSTGAALTGSYTFRYADGTAVNRSAVTPNKAITFTATDQATTYTWDFGDGSALAQGSPKEYAFTRGGSFSVRLTVARTGVPGTVTTAAPLSFVVAAPPDPLLWVAGGMAYADGSGGERWQSDLSIYNPGTQAASVSLAFVPGASWDGATNVTWASIGLGAGETRAFSNVLADFFGAAKGSWGVVLVRGDDVPVAPIIVSRTYNAAAADTAGTFGLSVPAVSVSAGVKPQSAAGGNFLAGLRHDDAFRTNLTVANLKDETAEVEVTFRDAAGNVLGAPAKVTVEGRGVKQLNGALSAAVATGDQPIGGAGYATSVSHFSAEVKIKRGSGVYPYATVIDQGTGDSIVISPTPRPSATYRLPGIVRVRGGGGTYWVSDVAVLNPTSSTRRIRVSYSYIKTGTTRRIEVSDVVPMAPYQLLVAVDFVKYWLGLAEDDPDGYASSFVDISPAPDDPAPNEPLVVAGKTYTPSGRGSIGLQLDPYVLEDGMSEQGARRKLVLSGLEAREGKFRTNIALFLTPGATGSIQVDVHVLDSFGRESKKLSYVGLDASNPFVQMNSSDLFSGFSTGDASRATVVIDAPRGGAYLGAYATVIDEKSGDATFVAGQPAS